MFYYTFSVINTMFVPCTALLYEQNKIVQNSIEHFLCNPSDFFSDDVLSCLWIVFPNSVFQVLPSENNQAGWDLGNRMARGLLVWREMSLCDEKLCLRYSSVLFDKWGTISFQSTTLNRTLQYFRYNFSWDRLISCHTDNPWLSYS